MRLEEWWDARLVIHDNPPIHTWTYTDSWSGKSTRVRTSSPGPHRPIRERGQWRSRLRNIAFAVWCGAVLSLAWGGSAEASYVEYSALDQIAQSYEIPITNASDGASYPSVLLVTSATLDTTNPDGSGVRAPRGKIYLSLQMSSGPIQYQLGQPEWGSYFSTMTPLPATALRYVAASGRSYPVTRINPIDQTNNFNSMTDDGMVDATYYFTVPISSRRGAVVISPCHTVGTQNQNAIPYSPTSLSVGGPTTIKVQFPKVLTTARSSITASTSTPVPGATFASLLNFVATVGAALLVGTVYLARRRRRRATPSVIYVRDSPVTSPTGVTVVRHAQREATNPSPTPAPTNFDQPPPRPQARPAVQPFRAETENDEVLRIDVLGPLTISPVFTPPSDPVRAILAYLAMNNERVLTLEEIQNAIWPLTDNGVDIKKPAMRNYMMQARKCVGERHLPTASGRPGYQLHHFDTDWDEFQRLLDLATKASRDEVAALRRRALDLVSGLPFTADTTRYFTWTFSTSVVYKIVESVTSLAHVLCTELVLAGDLTGAQVVVRQGLLTDPASLTLWEDLTDVLLESTDQTLLDLHWKAAGIVLRSDDVLLLRSRVNG